MNRKLQTALRHEEPPSAGLPWAFLTASAAGILAPIVIVSWLTLPFVALNTPAWVVEVLYWPSLPLTGAFVWGTGWRFPMEWDIVLSLPFVSAGWFLVIWGSLTLGKVIKRARRARSAEPE